VSKKQWANFTFIKGNISNLKSCQLACQGIDYVLHQAAIGSVPRSIKDPINTNKSNITGFLNMLVAAKDANVKNFVYAASSSTYGDHKKLPKKEHIIGNPLSPYAVTKYVNELYADVFNKAYEFNSIGLRYFNVFGKRQTPNSTYAAVIPKWIHAIIKSEEIFINGDGKTSRDFCFIENAIQANILAATNTNKKALNNIYNIALGDRTSLNELYAMLQSAINKQSNIKHSKLIYRDFRAGDVKHSQADISKAKNLLGYRPTHKVKSGIDETINWHLEQNPLGN
jgi:UDP-N-acetylglucosamine 4-epimerase